MPPRESIQQSWKQVGRNRRNDPDHDLPLFVAGHFPKFAFGFLQLAEDAFRVRQEGPPEHCQLRGTRQTIEEPSAQLRFELQDLLRQRRLSNVLHFGSAGKSPVTGDCAEIT